MLTAPTTGANRLDSAISSSSPSREVCLISSPSVTQHPVFYTKNGLATNTGRGGTINLKDDCYGKFGKFIATSLKRIEEHDGIHINYISPINEPDGHWNWTGPKQEGTPATNREFAKVAKEVSKALVKNKLNTEILINESSDYRCMLGTHMADWQRGYEINSFFTKDSTQTYLGKTKQLPPSHRCSQLLD